MVESHHQEYEEETRVEASQAYNILDELEQEGKITTEKARLYKQKFYVLHEACIKNMQNERKLSEKISQLKKVSCLRIESRKSNCFSHLCIAIVKWDTEVGEGWVAEDRPQVQASDPSREMGGC